MTTRVLIVNDGDKPITVGGAREAYAADVEPGKHVTVMVWQGRTIIINEVEESKVTA